MQEITELKNIVVQNLEGNGVLNQIRAQIRASVFKIIEAQDANTKKNAGFFWENPLCQTIYDNREGKLALEIINEFLDFFKMDYTQSVFAHESNLKDPARRDDLQKKLGVKGDSNKPLLFHIINSLLSGNLPNKENQSFGDSASTSLSKPAANAQKTNLAKNIASDLKAAEPVNKGFDAFGSKKTGLDQFQESKEKFDLGPKGGKLAPLSSLSPQDKFSVGKQTGDLLGGLKKPGTEDTKKLGTDFKKPGDLSGSSDKFKQEKKEDSGHDYDEEVFEELVEDFEDEDFKNKDKKSMLASSEDIIGASQSQGFDVSVDSLALEEYDYYEDASRPKK